MKPRRRLLSGRLLVALAALAPLAATADADGAVSRFAASWLQQQYSAPGSRVETRAAALDPRLQLDDCTGMMVASLPEHIRPMPRMSVQVRCNAGKGWAVRVPVSLKLYRQVLVSSRPLLRGDGLHADDVHVEERDIARLGYGYIDSLEQVSGRTLAHALPGNTVLTPSALGGREMIRAGDHVQVVAQLDGIQVRAAGVALGGGDNGARLRVRNDASGRVVDAMVSAPGVVLALP
jgi:flagella basal body P-ring formation protein FlgA